MHGICGIVLAAGGSSRLGEPKQLLTRENGETLVHAAVRAACEGGCESVCVVTGHQHEAVARSVSDLQPLHVHHEHWQRGIGSSLRLGLQAVMPASAVVILTCDQPAVDAGVIRALIQEHARTGSAIVASCYAGTLGVPALFDSTCFPELLALPDDRGAKTVILADPGRVTSWSFEAGLLDLDTFEDVQSWRSPVAASGLNLTPAAHPHLR